jgi:tripartite-type tricarboxylate transporter receptor subunit TctC
MKRLAIAVIGLVAWLAFGSAEAQEKYPVKPIKVIVPLGPGTVNDVVARVVGESLAKDLKTEIPVEYKPGAGGVVGSDFVAKSKPDGYTVGSLNSSALTTSVAIATVPYDPLKDFTMIANAGVNPAVLAVNTASPWKSLEEFLQHARQNPDKLSCGTSGVGTVGHFSLELLKIAAGVQIKHVPYKGSPQNLTALLGGHIECASQIWPAVAGHVQAGRLRVLAATSRVREAPELPTYGQKGFPQMRLEVSFGFYGPARLPAQIAARLVSAFEKAIKEPETTAKLEKSGFTVAYEGPKELSDRIATELGIAKDIATKAGIKPQ